MQEFASRSDMAPTNAWSYMRASFPKFSDTPSSEYDSMKFQPTSFDQQHRDAEVRQPAVSNPETSQSSRNTRPSDDSQTWQNSSSTEPMSNQQDQVSLPEMVTHLEVALRASERAREDGCNESSALRRYLAEVEIAAAGLVSRVHELEHLLTLSTASQENKDLDQLRGQMLMVTARDARQHAIAAAQAISTARQATMQLDQVKREASALTASQEEEIKRLSTDLKRCHDLLQEKDALLQEREREEQRLIYRVNGLEGALNASQLEIAAFRKQLEVMNKEAEDKGARFEELLQTLEFTKAAVRATEHYLQEAQIQKKDTAIQNELLQHEVADLQSREVQTTIAHYDLELCKVRAVLEGEKTHLLAELAKLRQGNQTLKGEVAEWRGKYNTVLKQTNCDEALVSTTYEPAEISCAKLRKFFSMDYLESESYMFPDLSKETSKDRKVPGDTQIANRSERRDTPDGQQTYLVQDAEGRLNTQLCLRGGEDNAPDNVNAWRLKFQERNEDRDERLLISDRSESARFCTSERRSSARLDDQLCLIDSMDSQNGQLRLADRGGIEHAQLCISGRQLGPGLQASKPVEGREYYLDSKSALEAEGKRKDAKKLRSVSFEDQLMCGPEDGTLALQEETCFEMGENLLAVAHRELCKLKRGKRGDFGRIPFSASLRLFGPIIFFLLRVVSRQASRQRSNVERDINDMIHEGLKYLETRLD